MELPPGRGLDLAVLVAVAEHGSVGAAARALGLAQPNASRSLRRLERELRLSLVSRGSRGSRLTADGQVVVEWARQVLVAHERLVVGAAALGRRTTATVAVAASQTIAEELLPSWLAALRGSHAELTMELQVTNSAEVGRLVSAGTDVGFIESPELPHTLSVPIHARSVGADRLVVVVAPDHAWARRTRPLTLAELAATPLVVREPGSGTRESVERMLTGFDPVTPALELASNVAVRVAVAAGAGPAVLSELAVQTAVAAGELRAVMVAAEPLERALRVIWSAERRPSPQAEALIEIATQAPNRTVSDALDN